MRRVDAAFHSTEMVNMIAGGDRAIGLLPAPPVNKRARPAIGRELPVALRVALANPEDASRVRLRFNPLLEAFRSTTRRHGPSRTSMEPSYQFRHCFSSRPRARRLSAMA